MCCELLATLGFVIVTVVVVKSEVSLYLPGMGAIRRAARKDYSVSHQLSHRDTSHRVSQADGLGQKAPTAGSGTVPLLGSGVNKRPLTPEGWWAQTRPSSHSILLRHQ